MRRQTGWRNPENWGMSPLTDNALRQQQARDEALEDAAVEIIEIVNSDKSNEEKSATVWEILTGQPMTQPKMPQGVEQTLDLWEE